MLTHVRKEARAYLQDWGYASPKPKSFVVQLLAKLGYDALRGHRNIHLSVSKGLDGLSFNLTVLLFIGVSKNPEQRSEIARTLHHHANKTSTPTRTYGRMNL